MEFHYLLIAMMMMIISTLLRSNLLKIEFIDFYLNILEFEKNSADSFYPHSNFLEIFPRKDILVIISN